jgi:hypothetical protein
MSHKHAFVVMPFSPTPSERNWTEVFEGLFKPALEECGYDCTRAEASRGSLIGDIVQAVFEADIVVADVTDRNPNVFYELGVRHSLRRGTIVVSQGTEHIPSDLLGYWCLTYGLRPAEVTKFKRDIKRIISTFEERPEASDSPVSDYLDRDQINISRQLNRDNVKKLGALLTELSAIKLALARQRLSGKPQKYSTGCLQLLLQTMYVDVGPELLKRCYELNFKLEFLKDLIYPPEVPEIHSTLADVEDVERVVADLRSRIAKGEFTEPTAISLMTWMPLEPDSGGVCRSDESQNTMRELDSRRSGFSKQR